MRAALSRPGRLIDPWPASIGAGLFLIAVGAILYFAVNAELARIDIETVGLILMIIGALGLTLVFIRFRRPRQDSRGPRAY